MLWVVIINILVILFGLMMWILLGFSFILVVLIISNCVGCSLWMVMMLFFGVLLLLIII